MQRIDLHHLKHAQLLHLGLWPKSSPRRVQQHGCALDWRPRSNQVPTALNRANGDGGSHQPHCLVILGNIKLKFRQAGRRPKWFSEAKDQVERENADAAAEAESTLVEAVAQEIERRSMQRSSKVANQRGGIAQLEHGRLDGWTSTPRGRDDGKKASERDRMTGERLQNQRPLGDEHPGHNSEENLGAQVPHQVEEAGSIVFHSSRNASEFKNDNKEAQVTTSAAAKESEEFLDKDAEILRLIEERRSLPKEEKQRLNYLSKSIRKYIREKKNEETARH